MAVTGSEPISAENLRGALESFEESSGGVLLAASSGGEGGAVYFPGSVGEWGSLVVDVGISQSSGATWRGIGRFTIPATEGSHAVVVPNQFGSTDSCSISVEQTSNASSGCAFCSVYANSSGRVLRVAGLR